MDPEDVVVDACHLPPALLALLPPQCLSLTFHLETEEVATVTFRCYATRTLLDAILPAIVDASETREFIDPDTGIAYRCVKIIKPEGTESP